STWSPKLRNRGGEGRAISGSRAVIVDSPLPNRSAPSIATAITRYRVKLSGNGTSTVTVPSAPVVSDGAYTASASKFARRSIGEPLVDASASGAAPAGSSAVD